MRRCKPDPSGSVLLRLHCGIDRRSAASQHVGYSVALARSEEEVREAQRLRYKVFVEELGAQIHSGTPDHDIDRYDPFCEHLIVRESHADRIVGCRSTFFDLKEGSFPGGFAAIKGQLLALVKNLKPRKVFTHTNEDPHPDHLATHAITLEVLQEARVKAEVYLFSIWNPFSLRKSHAPRLYVDTTHTFGKKIRAIRHFQSQRPAMLVLLWGILARELKNGLHIGTRIAECFYRIQIRSIRIPTISVDNTLGGKNRGS